jgi:hypothetical protein
VLGDPKEAFKRVIWSNDDSAATGRLDPQGTFAIDFSALQPFCKPWAAFISRDSNHQQGIRIGIPTGNVLTVREQDGTNWKQADNEVEGPLSVTGVSYPQGHQNSDFSVIISGWVYPGGGFLLLTQWDDIGGWDPPTPDDHDYNDGQFWVWLPIDGTFTAKADARTITIRLEKA